MDFTESQSSSHHTYLILDTSAYLHYRSFAEVDWRDIVGASTVTLVVPAQVIRELDKQKDHHRSRTIRERAGRIVAKLKEVHAQGTRNNVRDGVTLKYLRQPPSHHAFDTYGLDPNVADEYILAAICTFKENEPNADFALVARDTTLQWTGAELGLRVIEAPSGIELADEPDPLEKENRDLRRELLALRTRLPVLSVRFASGDDIWRPTVEVLPPINASKLSDEVGALVERDFPPSDKLDVPERSAKWMKTELNRYEQQRTEYRDDLITYLQLLHAWDERRSRVLALPVCIANEGTTPAVDVTVELTFPPSIRVTEPRDEPRKPAAPDEPKLPSSVVFNGNRRSRFHASFGPSERQREEASGLHLPVFWGPRLTKNADGTTRIVEEFKKIQQFDRAEIGPVLLVFDSYGDVRPCGVSYVVRADDIEPVKGILHVVPAVVTSDPQR